ncbi:MAG: hypothetical protein CMJ50_02095 [Planctomycetaceae bacterium]|nr:hypothetical protein [Planctomycetaceae bacterium]
MPIQRLLIFLLFATTVVNGPKPVWATEPDAPIALIGGRLLTQTDQGNLTGDIVIHDGKILAVGAGIEIPANARRIDVNGLTVTPGLIDVRSTLWLTPAAAREAASDGRLNALDGVDPLSEDWREVARQGVTAVYVQPSGNLGGSGAVLAVAPSDSVDTLVIRSVAGGQATLGTTGTSTTSRHRFTQYDRIKKAFDAAKKYGEQKTKYAEYQAKQKKAAADDAKKKKADSADKKKKKDESSATSDKEKNDNKEKKPAADTAAAKSKTTSSTVKPPTKPTPDPAKDFLLRVLSREVPLRIEAHREDDIAHVLKLADEFSMRIVLEGASYPRAQLQQLIDRRTNLVLGPIVQLESSPSYRKGRGDDWLTSLTSDGLRWALSTFGEQPRTSRLLRVQAAAAVALGVQPQRVLQAITSDAAAILGVDDRLGTLAKGKRADVVVFAGDPLDPATPVRLTISEGKVVYEAGTATPTPIVAMAEEHLPTLLPESYVIKSTRLLRKGTWQPGRFLMRNGKIVALAPDKKLPISIPVYDLGAAPVTSGLLVAHGSLSATASIDDRSEADASNIQAADAYDPSDPRVTKLLEAGFLRVAFSPGSTNVVAGAVCQVRIGAANPVRGNVVAMKFVLSAKARDAARYPGSLAGQVELMREVLQAKGVRSRLFAPVAIEQALLDERKQRIKSVLRKRTTALFEANSSAEIRAAIRLVERFEIRGVLVSPDDVSPFIDDLKRLDIGVVARPVRTGDYDRYVDGLAKASTAGVHIAFGSTADEDGRMTAALAVSAGMSREAALSGLTAGGAKLLGMPINSCALVVGAPGDFVVWNGSPLDLRCRPTNVVVDGKIAFATTAPGDSESNQPEAASLGQVNSEGP